MSSHFSIGRFDAGKADILLPDKTISALHAEVYIDDNGQMFLSDLGSSNGTVIIRNGKRIPFSSAKAALNSSDTLLFGGAKYRMDDILSKLSMQKSASAVSPKYDLSVSSDTKMRRCVFCGSVTPLHGSCIECSRAD